MSIEFDIQISTLHVISIKKQHFINALKSYFIHFLHILYYFISNTLATKQSKNLIITQMKINR
nr:MAG TPA: hypothetical protein [Caudoviricetes sp.]